MIFDSAYAAILCRLNDYGWTFVSLFSDSGWCERYKKQGYWTEVGEAWCGLRLKEIRILAVGSSRKLSGFSSKNGDGLTVNYTMKPVTNVICILLSSFFLLPVVSRKSRTKPFIT